MAKKRRYNANPESRLPRKADILRSLLDDYMRKEATKVKKRSGQGMLLSADNCHTLNWGRFG